MGFTVRLLGPMLRAVYHVHEAGVRPMLPHPDDEPSVAVPGPSQLRVLIIGGGIAEAYGVRSQALAATGQLARALHQRTGRGTVVDVRSLSGESVDRIVRRVGHGTSDRYDAVVLSIGFTDATSGVAPARWQHEIRGAITLLQTANPDAAITVMGTPPVQRSATVGPTIGRLIRAHAAELNRITKQVAREFASAEYIEPPVAQSALRLLSAAEYHAIGEALAESIAPRLPPLPGD